MNGQYDTEDNPNTENNSRAENSLNMEDYLNAESNLHAKDISATENNVYTEMQEADKELQENETEKINPWRDPISLITWGFLMTSFTLNFLLLQYILPTIGVALLYLGFRSLRRGNRLFYTAWILSGFKLLWQLIQLVLCATPAYAIIQNNLTMGAIVVILQLVLLYTFRMAIRSVFEKEGRKPSRDPALGLICWTLLITVCAFTSMANNWIIFIPLIIFYLVMIHSLYKVGDDMSDVADAFTEAPVRLKNRVVAWGYLILCIVVVAFSSAAANHISLGTWEQTAVTDSITRSKLLELGFPKDILTDISDEDISLLSNAFHVEYSSDTLNYGNADTSSGNQAASFHSLFGSSLQATTVYTELPDNNLYVIVYFDWKDGKAYWQDGFSIWGEEGFDLLNGVLLFQKNGTDYSAPIPRLICEEVTTNSWFGSDVSRQIYGAVNYPFSSEHQRGYIFYRLQLPSEQYFGGNCFNYMHNPSPFVFPYSQTEKRVQSGIFNNNVKQHYTNFETQASRDANPS